MREKNQMISCFDSKNKKRCADIEEQVVMNLKKFQNGK